MTFRQKSKEKQDRDPWYILSSHSVRHIEGEMLDSKMAAAVKYSEEHHCILLSNGKKLCHLPQELDYHVLGPRLRKYCCSKSNC